MSGNAELRALAEKARDADGWTWPRAALVEACTPARILALLDAHDAAVKALEQIKREAATMPGPANWAFRIADTALAEVQP